MRDTDDFKYRHTVTFPPAEFFAVDDVLNFLAAAVNHDNHAQTIERLPAFKGNWGKYATEIRVEIENENETLIGADQGTRTILDGSERSWLENDSPEYLKKQFIDYKGYLAGRLLKAVKQGKFELRDWSGRKVIEPPLTSDLQTDYQRNYQTPFWWIKMASIEDVDLVNFCAAEKIRVIFETESPTEIISISQPTSTPTTDASEKPEKETPDTELSENLPKSLPALTTDASEKPFKERTEAELSESLPRSYVAQLAIKIACGIEAERGKFPQAGTVMEILQHRAKTGVEPSLTETKNGVFSREAFDAKPRHWDVDACRQTLNRWRKKRDGIESK